MNNLFRKNRMLQKELIWSSYDIETQLNNCSNIGSSEKVFIKEYLIQKQIYSISDISISDIIKYRKEIFMKTKGTLAKKKYQASLLEQCMAAYQKDRTNEIVNVINVLSLKNTMKNKLMVFFLANGIQRLEQITYQLRMEYQCFLKKTISDSKLLDYLKGFDQLKLKEIYKKNQEFGKSQFVYKAEEIFLLYHPDFEIAKSFYYTRNKEELLFDFSVNTSEKMKAQIFQMLNYVLQTKKNRKDRRERYLIPLQLFYKFCINRKIEDIEKITEKQKQRFYESLRGRVGSKEKIYSQIVDNTCKYLFMSGQMTNWKATTWYLEKFNFSKGRMNPAREIQRLKFGEIEIEENREMFQLYCKYQIGVSNKNAIQTIRMQYYSIKEFLKFLDQRKISLRKVMKIDMEEYIKNLNTQKIQPETYNQKIITMARFLDYLHIKKKISKSSIHIGYYLKKTIVRHNDRMVDMEQEIEILENLKYFSNTLRLIYLNLWCLGLRLNEVCAIRQDAYRFDGKNAWIRVYQNKMKMEKEIPIPMILYELMCDYINQMSRLPGQYVFQNKKGKAYDAGTFSKQFRKRLNELGIKDYSFRSHDFRHTVATQLYKQNVPIGVIRDYLGHKSSEMTKRYLDMMMESVMNENAAYFKNKKIM